MKKFLLMTSFITAITSTAFSMEDDRSPADQAKSRIKKAVSNKPRAWQERMEKAAINYIDRGFFEKAYALQVERFIEDLGSVVVGRQYGAHKASATNLRSVLEWMVGNRVAGAQATPEELKLEKAKNVTGSSFRKKVATDEEMAAAEAELTRLEGLLKIAAATLEAKNREDARAREALRVANGAVTEANKTLEAVQAEIRQWDETATSVRKSSDLGKSADPVEAAKSHLATRQGKLEALIKKHGSEAAAKAKETSKFTSFFNKIEAAEERLKRLQATTRAKLVARLDAAKTALGEQREAFEKVRTESNTTTSLLAKTLTAHAKQEAEYAKQLAKVEKHRERRAAAAAKK